MNFMYTHIYMCMCMNVYMHVYEQNFWGVSDHGNTADAG